jgi:pyruvate/2-oxoglutarate/acetoin dehydrogenase E1 component
MAIMTCSAAQQMVIDQEMRKDPKRFYISGIGLAAQKSVEEFGWDRNRYTGICETQIAGAGVGAAMAGAKPIISLSSADFAQDCWGQIVLQAAKMRFKVGYKLEMPLTILMSFAGGYPLTVHHSGCYHNWVANAPGLMVAVPSTPADVMGILRTVLRTQIDPTCFMLGGVGAISGPVPDGDFTIPLGKADIKREGKDVTLVAVGYWVHEALDAAADLAKDGISVEVWDPRMLTPLDRESLIASVKKTKALVVVDQAPKSFGTTGEFMATIAEIVTPVPPMARCASRDVPIAAFPSMKDWVYPNKKKIIAAVKDVLARKKA